MNANSFVVGVDGGGSKTTAWLARVGDDPASSRVELAHAVEILSNRKQRAPFGSPCRRRPFSIIGEGFGGSSNPQVVGFQTAIEVVGNAIAQAVRSAGLQQVPINNAIIALAGAGRAEDQNRLTELAYQHGLAGFVSIIPDSWPIWACGTPEGWGVGLIVGTGSMAFGCDRAGVKSRAGGWGYLFGDEGSGYWMGLRLLQAVAKAVDHRGPATVLSEKLFAFLGIQETNELFAKVYRDDMPRRSISGLAPLVLENAFDPIANEIIEDACRELAVMVESAARIVMAHGEEFPLALAGGVVGNSPLFCERLVRRLETAGLRPDPVALVHRPVLGCVQLAAGA